MKKGEANASPFLIEIFGGNAAASENKNSSW